MRREIKAGGPGPIAALGWTGLEAQFAQHAADSGPNAMRAGVSANPHCVEPVAPNPVKAGGRLGGFENEKVRPGVLFQVSGMSGEAREHRIRPVRSPLPAEASSGFLGPRRSRSFGRFPPSPRRSRSSGRFPVRSPRGAEAPVGFLRLASMPKHLPRPGLDPRHGRSRDGSPFGRSVKLRRAFDSDQAAFPSQPPSQIPGASPQHPHWRRLRQPPSPSACPHFQRKIGPPGLRRPAFRFRRTFPPWPRTIGVTQSESRKAESACG